MENGGNPQEAAEQEGLEDPVLFQHRKLSDEKIDIAVRASITNNISSYYYPKWGTLFSPTSSCIHRTSQIQQLLKKRNIILRRSSLFWPGAK